MARKEKKYHFIYKTTNLLSGKYYIGMHSTDNLDDGYMGSGNRLRLAIRKHGKESFEREILEFIDSREELKKREEEIVNLNEIGKEECMNLRIGGTGGSSKLANLRYLEKLNNNSEFRKMISEQARENSKRLIREGKLKPPTCDWTGRTHKDETKKLMSEKAKLRIGDKNSQYGTCWITNGTEIKKIKKEDLEDHLQNGWIRGRKIK